MVIIIHSYYSTFSVSDISKDASTINAQDHEIGSHDDEPSHMYESDVEKHFKSGTWDLPYFWSLIILVFYSPRY